MLSKRSSLSSSAWAFKLEAAEQRRTLIPPQGVQTNLLRCVSAGKTKILEQKKKTLGEFGEQSCFWNNSPGLGLMELWLTGNMGSRTEDSREAKISVNLCVWGCV